MAAYVGFVRYYAVFVLAMPQFSPSYAHIKVYHYFLYFKGEGGEKEKGYNLCN